MEQIRNILQQRLNGASIRAIASRTGISRNTVRTYLRVLEDQSHEIEKALALNDEALGQLLYEVEKPPSDTDPRFEQLSDHLAKYANELKKRHVTRQILWEEYRQSFPDGYGYTRFCHHLNEYVGQKEVTAIFKHHPGEKLMVDFAGDKLGYLHRETGEIVPCEVLVTVLPYSSYIYVQALPSQRQEHFVQGLVNAFEFLGGVPQCVLCDNLKAAVKKANRYEPSFTDLIEQIAVHYQTTFMATRPRKPKDKASVETSVRVSYNRIYTKLRNQQAHSLTELNQQIKQALKALNQGHFKNRDYSRQDLFLQYEQSSLKPLPSTPFEVKKSVLAKVQRNYHIILGEDWHQYSVPYIYAGKQVKVIYTSETVEMYHDHKRIALHSRNYRKNDYTTQTEHMPENHQITMAQKGWNSTYFLREADKLGPNVRKTIEQILESKAFIEQTYNACLGILRLAGKYGTDRLEIACGLMLDGPRVNYTTLDNILKNNMDKKAQQAELDFKTPPHDNIRGPEKYN